MGDVLHAAAGALMLAGAVALVWSFRAGTPTCPRMAPASLLALFVGVSLASGALGPDALAPAASPVSAVVIGAAAALLVAGAAAAVARHRRVDRGAAAQVGAVAAVVVVQVAAVALKGDASAPAPAAELVGALAYLTLWLSFGLLAFVAASAAYRALFAPARTDVDRPFSFILVHGAKPDGAVPSPVLASRLDAACGLWERQDGRGVFIVSGGKGADDEVSEAAAMRGYLLDHGVSADAVIMEDRSTTTLQNLVFSRAIMDCLSGGAPYRVALATSEFHAFRCAALACRLGFDAEVVAAPTRLSTWLRSFAREYGAVLLEYPRQIGYVALIWLAGALLA